MAHQWRSGTKQHDLRWFVCTVGAVGLVTVGFISVGLTSLGLAGSSQTIGALGGFLFMNLPLEACVLEFLLLPMMTVINCIIICMIIEYNLLFINFTCDSCN